MSYGSVGILNVGAGDTKLSFDPTNPAEVIRAGRIVKDMLRRGYALLVATGKDADGRSVYRRATDFDEKTAEYIIADFDPVVAQAADAAEEKNTGLNDGPTITIKETTTDDAPAAPTGQGRGKKAPAPNSKAGRRLKASNVHAVAVSRSAGG